jgi:hypothetical protein
MSALGTNLSGRWAGLRARASRLPGSPEPVSMDAETPGLDGACIRGFLFALLFEGASLAMLAALVFGIYTLQR